MLDQDPGGISPSYKWWPQALGLWSPPTSWHPWVWWTYACSLGAPWGPVSRCSVADSGASARPNGSTSCTAVVPWSSCTCAQMVPAVPPGFRTTSLLWHSGCDCEDDGTRGHQDPVEQPPSHPVVTMPATSMYSPAYNQPNPRLSFVVKPWLLTSSHTWWERHEPAWAPWLWWAPWT